MDDQTLVDASDVEERGKNLCGRIEIDDAYLGGEL